MKEIIPHRQCYIESNAQYREKTSTPPSGIVPRFQGADTVIHFKSAGLALWKKKVPKEDPSTPVNKRPRGPPDFRFFYPP